MTLYVISVILCAILPRHFKVEATQNLVHWLSDASFVSGGGEEDETHCCTGSVGYARARARRLRSANPHSRAPHRRPGDQSSGGGNRGPNCGPGNPRADRGANEAPATSAPTAPAATTAPTAAATAATAALPDLKGRALKIGSDTTYPPFESVNAQKQIEGFDVDMVNEICKRVKCTATFVTADFATLPQAVASKQYDAGVSAFTITDDRKKVVDFSDPYIANTEVVLVRSDESRIKSKDDLKNTAYIVAVQNGTTNEIQARKLVADANKQLKLYDTFDLAVAALKNKTADAVVIDTFAAYGYMDDPANKGAFKFAGDQFSSDEFLGMAFPKGSDLVPAFNAGLKAILKDGTMTTLCKKWWPNAAEQPDCSFKSLPQNK